MAERDIPIRLMAKRTELDDRAVEGMGNNVPPSWVTSKDAGEKSIIFLDLFKDVQALVKSKPHKDEYIPAVLKADLRDEAIAKSHRNQIKKLFETRDSGNNVFGLTDEKSVLIKIQNEGDAKSIERKIKNFEVNKYALSAIESLSIFKPQIRIPGEETPVIKVKLINFQNPSINEAVVDGFEKLCIASRPDQFKKTIYADGLNIYKIKAGKNTLRDLSKFEGIFSVEPMPQYEVVLDFAEVGYEIQVKAPKKGVSYPVVGLLDSGVADIPHISPWMIAKNHSNYPPDKVNRSHGTFVAGILLYSKELLQTEGDVFEGCKIFDAIIFPDPKKEKIDQDDLINNVREVVEKNKDQIKIWNLSAGTGIEIDAHKFSDFGIALDDIQKKNNVIICKSAGNCTNFVSGLPKSKLAQSADSVHSVVVGSIAHAKNSGDFSEINHPSPFSRVGRGPASLIKPDLAHYGGNAGVVEGSLQRTGVKSFGIDGKFSENIGTSFSVPRVTSSLASLQQVVDSNFDPLLLKALLIHSASYPEGLNIPQLEKLKTVGFGIPNGIVNTLFNAPFESTLVIQDKLEKGRFIEILDFPFPENLVDEDGYFYGEVILTLAYDPILEPSQGLEYCQSNMKVLFGTYEAKKARDTSKKHIKNPVGKDGTHNILLKTCYKNNAAGNFSVSFGSERLLIEYGDKFHPIKKYACDLSEMKPANRKKFLKSPKKWFLKLETLYREFCEKQAEEDGLVLEQNFCLIVTIRDPKKKIRVNEAVVRGLNANGFVHSSIALRENIRVHVGQRA